MVNRELYNKIKIIFAAIEKEVFTDCEAGCFSNCPACGENSHACAVEELEKLKEQYADVLPLQYWNLRDALGIKVFIWEGKAQTVQEAIALLERYV